MKTKILLFTLVLITFAFLGCGPLSTVTPYPTNTPYPTYTTVPSTSTKPTSENVPTTSDIIVPTEPPLGNAIIGALNNNGTAAIDTSNIGLHPLRHLDAAGKYRATYEDHIWVIPEAGTGIATFNGLEPGKYIVCFGQYGSWVRVGEITIEPYKTLRQNFRWPPSYNIGSTCDLNE